MKRVIAAATATAVVATTAPAVVEPPTAAATPPIVGSNGLTPNAWALAQYVRDTYPGVLSIGGVRADPLPDHPSGHAIDIMIGSNTALGDTILADIQSQTARFGIRYTLWRVPNHYDHIHVSVQ